MLLKSTMPKRTAKLKNCNQGSRLRAGQATLKVEVTFIPPENQIFMLRCTFTYMKLADPANFVPPQNQ
jgi:hypothetical protein